MTNRERHLNILNSGPWSEILEEWVVSEKGNFNTRNSRVMKLGDKTLMVSPKATSPNKRDVSETDLYLLGTYSFQFLKLFIIMLSYSNIIKNNFHGIQIQIFIF